MTAFQTLLIIIGVLVLLCVIVGLMMLYAYLRDCREFEQRLQQLADELDGVNEREASRVQASRAAGVIRRTVPAPECDHEGFGSGINPAGVFVCLACGKAREKTSP